MPNQKVGVHRNTVQYVSRRMANAGITPIKNGADRDAYVLSQIAIYKSSASFDQVKKSAMTNIVMHTWYLLPHILGPKKFNEALFDDALQNMVLAIMRAVKNFDHTKGTKFSTYVSGYLKAAINDSAMANSVVRPPASADKRSIIAACSVVHNYLQASDEPLNQAVSPPKPVARRVDNALLEQIGVPVDIEDDYAKAQISKIFAVALDLQTGLLDEKEHIVIMYRFGMFGAPEMTLSEVAKIFRAKGWRATKEWIYQVQKKALIKLRRYLTAKRISAIDIPGEKFSP